MADAVLPPGPFDGPVSRADVVARIGAHPVEGPPAAMRAAFARLALGAMPRGAPDIGAIAAAMGVKVAPGPGEPPGHDVTPVGGASGAPVIWLHGGGYVFGSPESHLRPAAALARGAGRRVVVPRYPLAPEATWPAQLDHALAVAVALGGPVVLAGDSAGGHLALVAALALARSGAPARALLLFSPNTDRTGLSRTRAAMSTDDPMNDDASDAALARACFGDMPADHPHVSPLLDDLSLLPPAHVEVGDPEVLLDDARLLAGRGAGQGARISLRVEPGLLHMGQLWAPWWAPGAASLGRAAAFLREAA